MLRPRDNKEGRDNRGDREYREGNLKSGLGSGSADMSHGLREGLDVLVKALTFEQIDAANNALRG
jgi:hypothetical protein